MCCLVTYCNNRFAYRIDGIDGELQYLRRNSIMFEDGKGDIWSDPAIYFINGEPGLSRDGKHVHIYKIVRSGSVCIAPLIKTYYEHLLQKSPFHYKPNK